MYFFQAKDSQATKIVGPRHATKHFGSMTMKYGRFLELLSAEGVHKVFVSPAKLGSMVCSIIHVGKNLVTIGARKLSNTITSQQAWNQLE